ncbi:iron-containing alcohol dehydrogenase family protein [Paenibacillus rhizophilus]|uniref:Iron-containing alcohol dehydrogenase n=1 Tax=Paenibacillus rhizophilus TaxID=1850366 RepID=A0A3N9Q2Q5_9BACL|nr:iron-containing alcohol dehydrogenase family protein [Paenibacillus rhizophilus]RQW13002.1 iron-containing alcohol dehydrogenase [Paenibacillus rhizophilus]
MITLKAPKTYIREKNILDSAGPLIAEIGQNALIIGGNTALALTGKHLLPSLDDAGVHYHVHTFEGECTAAAIARYARLVRETGVDCVIGIGGGRVLDLAKAAAEDGGVPVISVPTIAATCAAWSALTIIYDEEGRYVAPRPLKASPLLVLADTVVLASAPARYLKAGIADTIVKWHEAAPNAAGRPDLSLSIGLSVSWLALDLLHEQAVEASREAGSGAITQAFTETVDAVIALAGLAGSVTQGKARAALAHSIHNSLTFLPAAHGSLHGEKVIFGLIVQFVLAGKSLPEIKELISFLCELSLPVTLEQLGIRGDISVLAAKVAEGVVIEPDAQKQLAFEVSVPLLKEAILTADRYGRESLAANALVS